ncbi:hypothetical protein GCM10027286_19820 [Virgibacillus ainsalahensis]
MRKENHSLPPKQSSIDKLVTVPADVEKVINGQKTATRRSGRYADIGETMILKNRKFIVKDVFRQKLGEITDRQAVQEGYKNIDEYKQSILSIHPGMKWEPEMRVWVHEYEAWE